MPTKKRPKPSNHIFHLEIILLEIEPRIWRRFAITDNASLADLHDAIQYVMGWHDAHLHEFELHGVRYGIPDSDAFEDDEPILDERKFKLNKVLGLKGFKFEYRYDFGDNWEHAIKVVDVRLPEPGVEYPVCIAGERACPPEDCGSVPGYEEILEILKDPKHEEYEERLEWLGGAYDPEKFDLEHVNGLLRLKRA